MTATRGTAGVAQVERRALGQGRYVITDVLCARGGRVLLVAQGTALPQPVLIERITGLSAATLRRALVAAPALLALAHPNLARAVDCFVEDAALHVVMVAGPGAPLSDPHALLGGDDAVTLATEMCNALGYLAWRGIPHVPTIDPTTVFRTTAGRVKLTHLAALLGVRLPRRRTPFAAPTGHPQPAIFGIGATVWHLLAGWPTRAAAPALAMLRPDLHPDLCAILARALATEDGWPSPAALRRALLTVPER